jgi:hypothetical protein
MYTAQVHDGGRTRSGGWRGVLMSTDTGGNSPGMSKSSAVRAPGRALARACRRACFKAGRFPSTSLFFVIKKDKMTVCVNGSVHGHLDS